MQHSENTPPSQSPAADRVLVIKLAALGDFIQSIGPMQAIRRTYPNAQITLLTTAPYKGLAEASGLFDSILLDTRPAFWNLPAVYSLRKSLRRVQPDLVFDLQTSDRSSTYLQLFAPQKPNWSGIAAGCSHPHRNPGRDEMHTIDRQRDQLNDAGISNVELTDLSFIPGKDRDAFDLPEKFALLVPGGAPHRPEKRWPAQNFGALAKTFATRGLTPVVVGTQAEAEAANTIADACPETISILGKTSLLDMIPLARLATVAVGNDTGPMHLIAMSNCPSIALFSNASDPKLCGPRGEDVTIIQRPSLTDLSVQTVEAALVTERLP